MPFLTEELWHRLPQPAGASSIALGEFPKRRLTVDSNPAPEFPFLQAIILAARNIRADMKLDPKRKIPAELSIASPWDRQLIDQNLDPVLRLATLSELKIVSGPLNPAGGAIRSTGRFDLRVARGEGEDKQTELAKLKKESERLAKDIESKKSRLADDSFRQKAPADIVRSMEATLAERQIEYQKLLDRLAQLE